MVPVPPQLVGNDLVPLQNLPTLLPGPIREEDRLKVLVTGAAGLLGHDVWKLFEGKHDLIALGRSRVPWIDAPRFRECDLTNAAHTYAVVTKENPEVIVHCAAFNDVDGAQSRPEQA